MKKSLGIPTMVLVLATSRGGGLLTLINGTILALQMHIFVLGFV